MLNDTSKDLVQHLDVIQMTSFRNGNAKVASNSSITIAFISSNLFPLSSHVLTSSKQFLTQQAWIIDTGAYDHM